MRLRKYQLGTRNIIGANINQARMEQGMKQRELLAQLQVNGIDMDASGLSKLEGQTRAASDIELLALCKVLNKTPDQLLKGW